MFKLTIKTDNAAFEGVELEAEIARILRRTTDRVMQQQSSGRCLDSNGNMVGEWVLR